MTKYRCSTCEFEFNHWADDLVYCPRCHGVMFPVTDLLEVDDDV